MRTQRKQIAMALNGLAADILSGKVKLAMIEVRDDVVDVPGIHGTIPYHTGKSWITLTIVRRRRARKAKGGN